MKEVVFVKDFATKKAGDKFLCCSLLANDLVNKGVAAYQDDAKEAKKTPAKK